MAKRPKPTPRPQPERRNGVRQVADLLPEVGGAAFRKFGFVQSSIVSRWAEIAGERYARVSAPESIRFPPGKRSEGVLTLTVQGAHGTMMQHIAPEIVDRVNRFFGYPAVVKIVFKPGELRRMPMPPVAPPTAALPDEMGDSLRGIADPELKAVLAALAAGIAAERPIPVLGKIR